MSDHLSIVDLRVHQLYSYDSNILHPLALSCNIVSCITYFVA